MMLQRKFVFLILILILLSCDRYPRDTYDTYEEVRNGVLLAGYTENPPWIYSSPAGPDGIEAKIIEGFAESLGARVEWVQMNEQALLEELEHRNLHVVVSGLTENSPWTKRIAATGGYLEHNGRKHIIAVPPGEHRFLLELQTFINQNKLDIKQIFQDYLLEEDFNIEREELSVE